MPATFAKLGNYGRLGNQLFQIAATIGYALKNNDRFIFPRWQYEPFFNLHGCFGPVNIQNEYSEPRYQYDEIPYKPNCNLFGYFQSPKYFSHCDNFIRQILSPSFSKMPRKADTVSLHVRRGDYIKYPNHHPMLTQEWYENALSQVPHTKVLVFSDDMNWCKRTFRGNKFEFVEGNSECVDLHIQSICEHNIIANSSFSWWAAYLNDNPNKIVIGPKNWFGPALNQTHLISDLIPETWKLI